MGQIDPSDLWRRLCDPKRPARVEERLSASPNVYFLCGCTGTYDIIGVFAFHSPREFDAFVRDVIAAIPEITRTSTFVVMHVYLTTTGHKPMASIKGMVMGWDEVEVHPKESASAVAGD